MSTTREDFLGTALLAGDLLRDERVAAAWSRASALPEFSVHGLAGHLAFQVFMVRDVLAAPEPTEDTITLTGHYERAAWVGSSIDADFNVAIRNGGEAVAADGPDALAGAYAQALGEVAAALETTPNRPARLPVWGPWSMLLDDLLVTRTMELAVHSDDLAVSVGAPTPDLPPTAAQAVVDLLTRIALRRHGQTAVLRALSRAERAPATIAAL